VKESEFYKIFYDAKANLLLDVVFPLMAAT